MSGGGGRRLSVIVPCHNVARFLPVTLASVQANAADDVEWLFVDDGSTDGTGSALAAFVPRAGTATVLTNERAAGLAGARNRGLDAARGRTIAFLDADDWLGAGHLLRMTDAIERLGVDFVRSDHVQVEGRRRTLTRAPEGRRDRPLAAESGIVDGRVGMVDYPYAWSAVYDSALRDRGLLHVDPRIKTAEDRLLTWRLHMQVSTFAVVSEEGYFYRRAVPGSLSSIGDERQLHFFEAFDDIGALIDADPALERFRSRYVRSYLTMLIHHETVSSRLERSVHRSFRERARATVRSLPPALVAETTATLDVRRAAALRRLG